MEDNRRNSHDTMVSERTMITGSFTDPISTENAYRALQDRGYTKDEINVIMSDETRKKHFSHDGNIKNVEIGTKAAEGAGKGSAIGATIGAIAGIVAAVGTSLGIPGLGLVIAGPLAAGIAGAGAGGVTGGIIGALVGAGIPEERARLYESGVKKGHVVLGVHPRNDADAEYIEKYWRTNKGENVYR